MIINTVIAGGGTTPTGSISITNNGTYDVTDKATAVVNVPTTAPAHYIEKTVDANGILRTSANIINMNGVADVGDYVLYNEYRLVGFPANTNVDLSSLTKVRGMYACESMFFSCSGLTSFDLSALTTISGDSACSNMFRGCNGLTSANLPALTTISGDNGCSNMFRVCTGLTSANLPALTTISGRAACQYIFYGCTSLATVYIGGTTAIDFGTYTNQFNNMFQGCTQNIDVYAPAANQAKIEAMSGYPNFGGTGTVTWHWRS